MRVIDQERIGDRRVRLVVQPNGMHAVTLEVLGPNAAWEDISLPSDQRLLLREARMRYAGMVYAQRARVGSRSTE
jgi:hypothetical protein